MLSVAASLLVSAGPPSVAAGPTTPVQLSGAGHTAGPPDLVVDPSGTVTVAWARSDGTNIRIESARKAPGKPWSAVATLSAAGEDAYSPDLAVAPDGEVAAVWMRTDANDHYRVQSSSLPPGGTWSAPLTLSTAGDSAWDPRIAIDAGGGTTAAWIYGAPGTAREIEARRRGPSGLWLPLATLSASGYITALDLVAAPGGAVTAAWSHGAGVLDDRIVQARTAPDGTSWGTTATLASASNGTSSQVDAGVDDEGKVTVVWQQGGSNMFIWSARRVGGIWGTTEAISQLGTTKNREPRVAVRPDGDVLVSWIMDDASFEDIVKVRRWRDGAALWSSIAEISTLNAQPRNARPSFADGEAGVVTWEEVVGGEYVVRNAIGLPGSAWGPPQTVSPGSGSPQDTLVTSDALGNTLMTWLRSDGANKRAEFAVVDRSRPVAKMSPLASTTTTSTATVRWTVSDLWSAVSSLVLSRSMAWNGTSWTGWALARNTAATSAAVAVPAGRTTCFTVQPYDAAQNAGAASSMTCTTTPVDDRIATGAGWSKKTSGGAYLRTYKQATRRGATLALNGVRARTIALVVAKAKGAGKVAVYLGAKRLKTVSLAGPARQRVVIPIAAFSSMRTGKVRIKVVSSGKQVRIDGIVLGK